MYVFLFRIIQAIRWIINGKLNIQGRTNIPENEQFILVAPHRTWWDPLWFAIALLPKKFIFMGKKELFKNKLFAWALRKVGVFSVDRQNPGPSAIKIPVKELKSGSRNFMIFPSGSRHSSQLEGGAVVIAKMSGKSLLPVVYQGPLAFKGLFKRGSSTIAFGPLIEVGRKDSMADTINKMQAAFTKLDQQIDKDWHYVDQHPEKKNQD
ncbi:lysophospholipid acyltransferase family protein [Oenococcus kitaharae]|uniref:1-acyl-sn-glycerol-3-phosphate acyltransferase n=1 Tax=Oenococcus kitaharae DSM 17330 TaxID=1045004 RepID=G9WH69_9LACO|nr:1-acyl-sn-glycerol-3-phosphate acyltransferase [Oenococcus kitaharae]EHN59558.1 1-acyl-sn-glycerol-3-phosphate acyltransferase [Oenococcus kitaharae DSM 17330]OEY83411.1 acyl-phosphate glycerol 3-phosphate acyltransferase [Oenococcus kitaharae]OEY85210.1 acyl-phosphate glycerol 3-phosphate acyltransferase [Oenococcus kitaharae]OEY86064.1 acyl-phosphate glycerol 3-phosphate acyltransferase [Oenococcus kitaharae]